MKDKENFDILAYDLLNICVVIAMMNPILQFKHLSLVAGGAKMVKTNLRNTKLCICKQI